MGFPAGKLEPLLHDLRTGQHVSVVMDVLVHNPGCHVCKTILHHQVFVTDIHIQKGVTQYTILQGTVRLVEGKVWIQQNETTKVFPRPQVEMDGLFRVVEACAGISAVSQGYAKCGAATVCTVESNRVFHEWNQAKSQTPCVLGNIADIDTVAAVAAQVPVCHVLSAGISCQPFSQLGDMKEQMDSRSVSCPGALLMGFWLGSLVTILECTPQARQSAWVQVMLQEFAVETKCQIHQAVLSLHTVWPARRERWWCVISHPALALRDIPDLPALRFEPGVLHLMCQMLQLDQDPLSQLLLDPLELEKFNEARGGIQASFLDCYKACPTATHSWGSQLKACLCGCRDQGFHPLRLEEKGLYGRLIQVPGHQVIHGKAVPNARHLHPAEVALLNGMCPKILFKQPIKPLRLDLAGVGQMGSPLQSAWILGNILFQVTQQGLLDFDLHPRQILSQLCMDLQISRDQLFQDQGHTKYMEIFATEIQSISKPMIFKADPLESDDEGLTQEIAESLALLEEAQDNQQPTDLPMTDPVHAEPTVPYTEGPAQDIMDTVPQYGGSKRTPPPPPPRGFVLGGLRQTSQPCRQLQVLSLEQFQALSTFSTSPSLRPVVPGPLFPSHSSHGFFRARSQCLLTLHAEAVVDPGTDVQTSSPNHQFPLPCTAAWLRRLRLLRSLTLRSKSARQLRPSWLRNHVTVLTLRLQQKLMLRMPKCT